MTTMKPDSPSRDNMAALRDWADLLSLWRLCHNATCRRARACRGEVRGCFRHNGALLPDGVCDFIAALAEAQEEKLTFGEAIARLRDTPSCEALAAWNDAVRASLPLNCAVRGHEQDER